MTYTFDLIMNVTVTVPSADTEEQARAILEAVMYDADTNLGAWPDDGSPIVGTANLIDAPRLIEVGGEAVV